VTRVSSPTLLASSDFAVVVNRGGLYFAPTEQGKPLTLVRATPDGTMTAVATVPALHWLNGIAAAPDGSIYGTADGSRCHGAPSARFMRRRRRAALSSIFHSPGRSARF
jgi:hypothetical protein